MEFDELYRLAELIHETVEGQGWGCYHPGPGLAGCVGLARRILQNKETWSQPCDSYLTKAAEAHDSS